MSESGYVQMSTRAIPRTGARRVRRIFPPLPPGVAEPDWSQSACTEVDPDLFTPADWHHTEELAAQVAAAKQVCMACPIRRGCLEYGLVADAAFGAESVWGGMTPNERRRLVTERRHGAENVLAAS